MDEDRIGPRAADADAPDEEPAPEESPSTDGPLPVPDLYERMTSETAGGLLATARRKQGMTLAEIAARTRVREKLLRALEAGGYDVLPSSAYVKGYIQSYASALGIDPAPALEAYEDERRNAEPAEEAPAGPYGRYSDEIVPAREQAHAIPRTVWLVVLALFVLAGLVWTVSTLLGSEPETTPLPPETTTEEPAAEETATPGFTEEELSAPATGTTDPDQAGPAAYTMTVAVSGGPSWLRVTIGDRVVLEDTVEDGSRYEWEATGTATVRVGKPSNVSVTKDGEPVSFPTGAEVPTVELGRD